MTVGYLFDLDGLLADTETLGIKVARRICNNRRLRMTKKDEVAFVGVTDEKFYRELFARRKFGNEVDVQAALKSHFELYERLLETEVRAFPGAQELPRRLKDTKHPTGIVSGSTRKQIDMVLRALEITNCFDAIVSCDEVDSSKPDPEGYLLGARRLNLHPNQCIVFEDAVSGATAAKNAGMRVIGVRNNGQQALESIAHHVIDDLTQYDPAIHY